MDAAILPILLFGLLACALATALMFAARIFGPSKIGTAKQMPYESGMDPIHDTRRRFDVRFHLVAIAFLVFDVELLFLYPWAVASRDEAGVSAVLETQARGQGVSVAANGEAFELSVNQYVADGRLMVFCEVMLFIALLTASFIYAWRKGVFRWR